MSPPLGDWSRVLANRAIPSELDLDNDWSITEESFGYICDMVAAENVMSVVEFGSGRSTIRLALEFKEVAIVSYEHDWAFYQRTRFLIEKYGLQNRVTLEYSPLGTCFFLGRPFVSYNRLRSPGMQGDPPQMLLVDGPPSHLTLRGREAPLHKFYTFLTEGAFIVLDDASRPDESAILRNWLEIYQGSFHIEAIACGKGLAVMRKRHDVRPRAFDLPSLLDAWVTYARAATTLRKMRARTSLARFLRVLSSK